MRWITSSKNRPDSLATKLTRKEGKTSEGLLLKVTARAFFNYKIYTVHYLREIKKESLSSNALCKWHMKREKIQGNWL